MNYVIIGTGAAGIMAAKEIRKLKKDAQITMISADEQVHSRCMLHKYLSHERTAEKLSFVPEDFFEIYFFGVFIRLSGTHKSQKKRDGDNSQRSCKFYCYRFIQCGVPEIIHRIPGRCCCGNR